MLFKTVDGYLENKCPMRDFAILDSWTLSHKLKSELHTAMRSLIIHTFTQFRNKSLFIDSTKVC